MRYFVASSQMYKEAYFLLEVGSLKQLIALKTILLLVIFTKSITVQFGFDHHGIWKAQVTYFETPGHSPPMNWSSAQKPVAVLVDEKSAWLDNKIVSDGGKADSRGTQDENNEGEKSRNYVGEEEESLGGHYERVADLHGKLSSDISVDRWVAVWFPN